MNKYLIHATLITHTCYQQLLEGLPSRLPQPGAHLLLEELIGRNKHRRTWAWPRAWPGEEGPEAAEEDPRRRRYWESELSLHHRGCCHDHQERQPHLQRKRAVRGKCGGGVSSPFEP